MFLFIPLGDKEDSTGSTEGSSGRAEECFSELAFGTDEGSLGIEEGSSMAEECSLDSLGPVGNDNENDKNDDAIIIHKNKRITVRSDD